MRQMNENKSPKATSDWALLRFAQMQSRLPTSPKRHYGHAQHLLSAKKLIIIRSIFIHSHLLSIYLRRYLKTIRDLFSCITQISMKEPMSQRRRWWAKSSRKVVKKELITIVWGSFSLAFSAHHKVYLFWWTRLSYILIPSLSFI